MARTRTQAQAAARAATHASALQRHGRPEQRRMIEQHRRERKQKVQFSENVQVKELPVDSGNHAISQQHVPSAARSNVASSSNQRAMNKPGSVRSGQKSNIRTMVDLPKSPSPATPANELPRPINPRFGSQRSFRTLRDCPHTSPHASDAAARTRPQSSGQRQSRFTPAALSEVQQPYSGPRSSLLTELSPAVAATRKRKRADSTSFYQRPRKRLQFQYNATEELKLNLRHVPCPLQPEQIGALFQVLREELRQFAFDNFHFELTAEAQADWPLHEMADNYYSLMRTTQYIADGSQYGWRHFFTTPDSRASVIYGVIAEYIRRHIFSIPSFGLSEQDAKRVDDVDSTWMHFDSHVRARRRAQVMNEILMGSEWQMSSNRAIRQLAEELMVVLTPLLPPDVFAHNEDSHDFSLSKSKKANEQHGYILKCLTDRLTWAVGLHYSLRLTGINGSIIQFSNNSLRGEKWYGDQGAPQNCVNEQMMKKTQFHGWLSEQAIKRANALDYHAGVADGPDDEDSPQRPRIKMCCFPRVEMIVPRGPDMEQLAEIERRNALEVRSRAEADSSGEPGDSTSSSRSSSLASDASRDGQPDAMDWDVVPERRKSVSDEDLHDTKNTFPIAPKVVQWVFEERKGKWPADAGELRLSYMNYYPHLSSNDVYLEHEYLEPTEEVFIRKHFDEHCQRSSMGGQRRAHNGRRRPSDDGSTSSDSSLSSDDENSSSSDTSSASSVLSWEPGHSDATARAAYESHIAYLRGPFLKQSNSRTGWRHGNPIPKDQRLTLKQAIQQARDFKAASDIKLRVKFALHDRSMRSWAALTSKATHIDWAVSSTAGTILLAALCSHYGYDLPSWLLRQLRWLRHLGIEDVHAWLRRRWELARATGTSSAQVLLAVAARPARAFEALLPPSAAATATEPSSNRPGSTVTATVKTSAGASSGSGSGWGPLTTAVVTRTDTMSTVPSAGVVPLSLPKSGSRGGRGWWMVFQ
ncbi:uncharacterized protein HMPREF1541_07700 [Cyphellophora europaea CBS 101466]|uniref:Uncharacterized protein n=1 Tax=Cyphellophora europaea (strain CBS 101466) TaxID=1220924 RepID=W2RNI1_CYPE1|nr:uncharacterized protein HMPREF1541_07700 [Cyphellophora europaea CBS 101466]ETN38076.1 hypothetical protein HMPREF1541_07700 [Cyphellophora europaea CBS 101466]